MDLTDEKQNINNGSISNTTNIESNENAENELINNNMNQEQTNNNQSNVVGKDAKVNEILIGINSFLDRLKNTQIGGGNVALIANEREKVSRLFNILSVEEMLVALKKEKELTENVNDK